MTTHATASPTRQAAPPLPGESLPSGATRLSAAHHPPSAHAAVRRPVRLKRQQRPAGLSAASVKGGSK
jgi:hypothetical protein